MRIHVTTALASLSWALSFHRRHIAVVTALMAVPALQRFVIMSWTLPGPVAVISEVIVMAARIGLVVLVVRGIGPVPHARRSARAFLRERWPSLLVTLAFLAFAFAIFDLLLERVVPLAVPDPARDAYRSALFAAKNLSVIPFTMIWLVAVIRQVIRYPDGDTDGPGPFPVRRSVPPDGRRQESTWNGARQRGLVLRGRGGRRGG